MYSIKPISNARRVEETQQISVELQQWRTELSRFLDAEFFSTSLIVPIYQRQRNVLNLTYWHAIILTHRQSLLNNFAKISPQDGVNGNDAAQDSNSIALCLKAALDSMTTIDEIMGSGQMFHAFWVRGLSESSTIVCWVIANMVLDNCLLRFHSSYGTLHLRHPGMGFTTGYVCPPLRRCDTLSIPYGHHCSKRLAA